MIINLQQLVQNKYKTAEVINHCRIIRKNIDTGFGKQTAFHFLRSGFVSESFKKQSKKSNKLNTMNMNKN